MQPKLRTVQGKYDILLMYACQPERLLPTLAYAMACGKAIVSTPYWYARELLADGRGRLVPFRDSRAIVRELTALLGDEGLRNRLRKQAYQYGRQMVWRARPPADHDRRHGAAAARRLHHA